MEKQIEFTIPQGYKKSDKSTDEKLVFELIEEKNIKKEAREFLFDIFNKMKVRVDPNCPGHVYYNVDGMGTVFEADFRFEYLRVSYEHIWSVFVSRFSMTDSEIQFFIKDMVKKTFNWKDLRPVSDINVCEVLLKATLDWE